MQKTPFRRNDFFTKMFQHTSRNTKTLPIHDNNVLLSYLLFISIRVVTRQDAFNKNV